MNNGEGQQFPEEIKGLLSSVLRENEKIICGVPGDIDEDGNFGERWLFLTAERIIIVSSATKRIVEFQLNDVKSCFVKDYLGNSEMFFETKDGLKSVMRFSRDCLESFHNVAKLIDKIAKKDISPEEVNLEVLEEFMPKKGGVKKIQAFIWLMGFLKPYIHYVILAVILSLSITALNLTPPYLMKLLLDDVFAKKNLSMLIYIVLAFVSIYALNAFLGAAQNYTLSYLGQKLIYNIRVKVYEHLQRLSLGFYDRMSSGRIMTRVTDDVGRVQWFLTWGTQTLITSILQIMGIGVIIFSMNIYLAIFALLPIPIIGVGVPLFRKRAHRAYHKVWRRWADVSSLLWDTIPGIVVVKSFTQEKFELKRLVERLGNLVAANLKVTLLHIKFFPLLGFAISSGTAIVWWIGGQ
ncbi:MAG: ABC transporter transmembrane domain-containing protein, partial [Candidatus Bathyarchaeota archaeon]|nr:ABC transporter transmembrane domain-containing protein [Candidatus Bathyarchaeota archaeon]